MKRFDVKWLALLLMLCGSASVMRAADQYVVVAYVTSWSSGLPDPSRMTHINYAFGGVNSARTGVSISNTSRLQSIVGLKKSNPNLKVLLSIGGWGAGGFSPMSSDEAKRKAFAQDCLRVCKQYNLDGVDLDWEFPGNNSSGESSPSNEKDNYTLLCRDIREAFGSDYLLTMASNYTPGNYKFKDCIQYLDFVNVMCYNMASPPNHHAALYKGKGPVSNGYYSCQMAMNDHLNAGIPRTKLVMGMPLYGHEINKGEQSYQRAKNLIAMADYEEDWDDKGKVPWIKKKSDGSFYMDFENELSIEYKCRYIISQRFRGGMYWDYYSDDNKGTLRNKVYKELMLGDTDKTKVKLDENDMPGVAYHLYAWDGRMKQGTTYRLYVNGEEGVVEADPDFFSPEADGSFRFLPISGMYRVKVNTDLKFLTAEMLGSNGEPATLQSDGTGAIWVIGNEGIGKPSYATAGKSWDPEAAMCMAQLKAKTHQITLQVGKEMNGDNFGFKFYLQRGWGDEYTTGGTYQILISSDLFAVGNGKDGHDDGSIYLRSGKTLREGDVYRFTINCSLKTNRVILKAEDVTTSVMLPKDDAAQLTPWYTLDGIALPAPLKRGLYVKDGKKIAVK